MYSYAFTFTMRLCLKNIQTVLYWKNTVQKQIYIVFIYIYIYRTLKLCFINISSCVLYHLVCSKQSHGFNHSIWDNTVLLNRQLKIFYTFNTVIQTRKAKNHHHYKISPLWLQNKLNLKHALGKKIQEKI